MLSVLLIVIAAIFFTGIIIRTKSLASGRKGPGIMQPVLDVWRLFRKGVVYSETTSFVFLNNGKLQFYILYGILFILAVLSIPILYQNITSFIDFLKNL